MLCICTGLLNGMATVFCKCGGEILTLRQARKFKNQSLCLYAAGSVAAILQIYMLNLSMKYYNQIDIMPIF